MANRCEICGKGVMGGNSISHSHRRTKRKFHPNLRSVRAVVAGAARTVSVCAKCLKCGKVARPA